MNKDEAASPVYPTSPPTPTPPARPAGQLDPATPPPELDEVATAAAAAAAVAERSEQIDAADADAPGFPLCPPSSSSSSPSPTLSASLHGAASSLLRRSVTAILRAGPIPAHVAFIMDGNRRYAEGRGAAVSHGHEAGYHKVREREGGDWACVCVWERRGRGGLRPRSATPLRPRGGARDKRARGGGTNWHHP